MPETIKVWLDDQIGISGQYLWLRKSDGTLLNTGGDALTESPASSGQFSATVAESRTGLGTLRAVITASSSAADAVAAGWLAESATVVVEDYPTSASGGAGDASQTTLLAVQTTVNTIASQTGQITGARLSVAGAVTPGGTIQLIVGKDYVTAASNGLTRSISDSGAALYDRLTSASLAAVKRFGASRPNGIAQITGTIASVTHASGMTSITIEIDRAAIPDSLTPAADYLYQIERETSDGDRVVEIEGTLTLSRRTV